MAIIIVTRNGSNWAKGEGEVSPKAHRAEIHRWIDKGAMEIGKEYGLQSEGKVYTGRCQTDTLPIVFTDVV